MDLNKLDWLLSPRHEFYSMDIGPREAHRHDVHFIRCVRELNPSAMVKKRPNPWSNHSAFMGLNKIVRGGVYPHRVSGGLGCHPWFVHVARVLYDHVVRGSHLWSNPDE